MKAYMRVLETMSHQTRYHDEVINTTVKKWNFLKEADMSVVRRGVSYYLALKDIIDERKYKAISLKDVDGMKKLLGFPPAMIFMLLAERGHSHDSRK